jgi:hypothetical protein
MRAISKIGMLVGLAATSVLFAVQASSAAAPGADRVLYARGADVVELSSGATVMTVSRVPNLSSATEVAQSPDGAKMAAFASSGSTEARGGVSLFGADGGCRVDVPNSSSSTTTGLSWAPDSVRLAMGGFTGSGIAIIDTGTPGASPVPIRGTENSFSPAWYPSSTVDRIAFTRVTGNTDVDIDQVDPATGVVSTLIGGPTFDASPAWSPDGTKLAFTRAESFFGATTLYVAKTDESDVQQLATMDNLISPSWTADGSHILAVYAPPRNGPGRGIYQIDASTGAAERLTTGNDFSPIAAPLHTRSGYVTVTASGQSYGFGASCSASPATGFGPIVAATSDVAHPGHWQVDAAGHVRGLGNAAHFGDLTGQRLNQPIIAIAAHPDGGGYWLIARDGGVFSFGNAVFHGSTGAIRLNQPIVGGGATPDGQGYWLVAADGGVFSFGDARFYGSTGAIKLNQPIVGMQPTLSGQGYWLVARDGGIFTFGDAVFHGSTGAIKLNQPVVGMASSPDADGYQLVAADGGVFSFGTVRYLGSTGAIRTPTPTIALLTETFRDL